MPTPTQMILDESKERLERDSVVLHAEIKSWWVLKVMKPLEDFCVRHRISPNVITFWGLGMCAVCATLFATGHILSAGWCVLLTGSLDFLDGRVARATNQVTIGGSFLDSVIDRYQDFLLFSGLMLFFYDSWVFYLALAALCGTMAVSYVRAKADIVGVDLAKVGTMQRPERMFLVGFGSLVSSIFQVSLMPFYPKGEPPPQHLLILVMFILALGTNWTAIARIAYTMRALKAKENH